MAPTTSSRRKKKRERSAQSASARYGTAAGGRVRAVRMLREGQYSFTKSAVRSSRSKESALGQERQRMGGQFMVGYDFQLGRVVYPSRSRWHTSGTQRPWSKEIPRHSSTSVSSIPKGRADSPVSNGACFLFHCTRSRARNRTCYEGPRHNEIFLFFLRQIWQDEVLRAVQMRVLILARVPDGGVDRRPQGSVQADPAQRAECQLTT